ncbi:MAG TPA: hypothetical protein VLE22_05570, partial [Bryobacteraceae bacterium]|nr:hypothetical protein [Bryobacteraceae bacterium]
MRRLLLAAVLSVGVTQAQPAGVILSITGGLLRRAGTQLALTAKSGDILFPGDALATQNTPAAILFCPEKSLLTLQAQTEVLVDARQLKIRTGSLGTPKPVSSCFLPPVDRTTLASQQHYGASLVRALKPEPPPPQLP